MFLKPYVSKSQSLLSNQEKRKMGIDKKLQVVHSKAVTFKGEQVSIYTTDNPMYFMHDCTLYPTCYNIPSDLKICQTPRETFKYLFDGADLMIPGMIIVDDFVAGDTIGVCPDSTRDCWMIGVALVDSNTTLEKGKGVKNVHFMGDYLWKAGNQEFKPTIDEDWEMVDDVGEEQVESLSSSMIKSVMDEEPVQLTENMDDLLLEAFLIALKRANFPMVACSFYSQYIASPEIDIKKSSFKKLRKFLKAMEKKELIRTKENKDLYITQAFLDHPLCASIVVKPEKKELPPPVEKLQVEEYFKPAKNTVLASILPMELLDKSQLKQHLDQYFTTNNLLTADYKNFQLDDEFHSLLKIKDRVIPRQEAINLISQKMIPYYKINGPFINIEKQGILEPMKISVCKKSNHWKTIFKGFTAFGIPESFVDEVKAKCASNVSLVDQEIHVQGNAAGQICDLLSKYGIIVQKTPKGKPLDHKFVKILQ